MKGCGLGGRGVQDILRQMSAFFIMVLEKLMFWQMVLRGKQFFAHLFPLMHSFF